MKTKMWLSQDGLKWSDWVLEKHSSIQIKAQCGKDLTKIWSCLLALLAEVQPRNGWFNVV